MKIVFNFVLILTWWLFSNNFKKNEDYLENKYTTFARLKRLLIYFI